MDDYERVLLVKPDVQVYRIPTRVTNRAYRASDWNLDTPDWTCRLRLVAKGTECLIKLDEKSTGQFFGQCPIDKYPGTAVESVSDSSRYFVLKLVNEQSGKTAFVGIGFVDRSDSFDLNVALQDHFKILQMENDTSNKQDDTPKLDLGFKEGQTIKVNLNFGKKSSAAKPRPKGSGGLGGILLPPPPTTSKTGPSLLPTNKSSPPSSNSSDHTVTNHSSNNIHQQLLEGLESLSVTDGKISSPSAKVLTPANSVCIGDEFAAFDPISQSNQTNTISTKNNKNDDLWSDFESFGNTASNSTTNQASSTTPNSNFDDWAKF